MATKEELKMEIEKLKLEKRIKELELEIEQLKSRRQTIAYGPDL